MRKFRFKGNPEEYDMKLCPDRDYNENHSLGESGFTVDMLVKEYPEEWEEVTEQDLKRIPNQDMPASSMTKFEMAVFMVIQGLNANPEISWNSRQFSEVAIEQVKETFKQLDNETGT